MFYSIQVGEDPDSVFFKIEKSEPSQDDTDQPLLLAPKILPFPKELELHLFSISIQEFLCVSTPLWDPEKWTNFFLRNTYKIHDYKKRNGNPTEFVICYPLV